MTKHYENRNILSFRVARELIRRGFPVVDFAASRKYAGKVVVKFKATEEFDNAFRGIMREMSTDQ